MISMLTVLVWQKSSVLVRLIAFDTIPLILALFSAEKIPHPFPFCTILLSELSPLFFPADHVHKNQWDAKINGTNFC